MGSLVTALVSHLAAQPQCNQVQFLGLVPWYHYLTGLDPNCNVTSFTVLGANSDFILIILAVVDDLLRVIGLLSVFFVIYAGIKYTTSQGSPDGTAKAQSTLFNALIGLGISLIAVRFVAFLAGQLGGNGGGSASTLGFGIDLHLLPNPGNVANGGIIALILNIVFGIIGAVALLIIVMAGFSYVTSQGDTQKVARAKSSVLYALIGLIVAIVAQSIVSLVASKL